LSKFYEVLVLDNNGDNRDVKKLKNLLLSLYHLLHVVIVNIPTLLHSGLVKT